MDAVVKWYDRDYPYTDTRSYERAIKQVRKEIKDKGVTAVKKALRDLNPGFKLYKTHFGEYELWANLYEVYVDFKRTYITKANSYNPRGLGYTLAQHHYKSLPLFVTNDQPFYNGIPLSVLIEWGEECEDCGVAFVPNSDETVCSDCERSHVALEYSAKAEDILGFEDTKETLFGIELEYEKVTAKQVNKCLKDHAIAKRDGSIYNGVEVVTKPACLKTHKDALKSFYSQVKVKAESNTGMHVHVDKRKLSQYQIGFMLQFLNDPTLVSNIETVAGREYSSNNYCRVKEGTKMTTGLSYDGVSKKIIRAETDKYVPLNTRKPHTIEVRIFSSPETHEEMCSKLDFVAALVAYSSPYSVSVKSLADKFKWETFIGFIQANKKDFPDFVSFYMKKES